MPYTVVSNTPNRIATVHQSECSHLGNYGPETASSQRQSFDDVLQAIAHAKAVMPNHVVLCGHCLKEVAKMVSVRN